MRLPIAPMLATFAAAALFPSRADASPAAHLVYVRDPAAAVCPDEDSLRQAVRRRVGYDPFFPWAKTTVVVEMTSEGESFVARVRLVDESLARGTRELRSGVRGCAGLIDAAALAISIALDTNGSGSTAPEPAPASAPEAPLAAATTPAPAPAPAPFNSVTDRDAASPSPSSAVRGLVGFDALAAIKLAPAVTPGFDLWAAARRGIGSLGVELQGDWPSSVEPANGGRASVLYFGATVVPCAHAGPVFGCLLGTLGWLHASGSDVRNPGSGSAFAPSIGSRVGLEVPLGRSLALRVRGDLLVHLVHPDVSLNGNSAWTLPSVGGIVATGLAYSFP